MNSDLDGQGAAPAATATALGPVEESSRIDVMDILRGFALTGIIFMNVEWFTRSTAELGYFDVNLTGLDHAAGWFVRCFVEGKFYKLFTLLFGMGFAVMLLRAQQAGRPFGAWFSRRMFVLLLFGLFHAVFIWNGDILHDYAIGGFIFLGWVYLFRTRRLERFNKPGTFLRIGLVWLALPVMAAGVAGMIYSLGADSAGQKDAWARDVEIAAVIADRLAEPAPEDDAEDDAAPEDDKEDDSELTDEERKQQRIEERVRDKRERAERADEENALLSQGSYADSVRHRLSKIPKMLGQAIVFSALLVLPICLVGYWFIASGVLKNHREHRSLFRNMALVGTTSGFVLSVGGLMIMQHPAAEISRTLMPVGGVMFHLSQFLMSAGYMGAVILLADSRIARRAMLLLAPLGRMALTNYIAQSLILSAIFYGYGAGLYGTVGRASQMLLVIGILVIQVVYSRWWMARFRFGPLEWVWRSATYKSLQPMRISPPQ